MHPQNTGTNGGPVAQVALGTGECVCVCSCVRVCVLRVCTLFSVCRAGRSIYLSHLEVRSGASGLCVPDRWREEFPGLICGEELEAILLWMGDWGVGVQMCATEVVRASGSGGSGRVVCVWLTTKEHMPWLCGHIRALCRVALLLRTRLALLAFRNLGFCLTGNTLPTSVCTL